MDRSAFARPPDARNALMSFAAARGFRTVQIVATRAGMGIDDPKGRGFEAQMQEHAH
jgi:hypothetical protein